MSVLFIRNNSFNLELSFILFILISAIQTSSLINDAVDVSTLPLTDNKFQPANFEDFYQNLIEESRLLDTQSRLYKASTATVKLEWTNCGKVDDVILLKNIVLDPNPFKIPGQLLFSFDMQVAQNLTAPLKLEVEMKKRIKIFGISTWVTVPCFKNVVGSCVIDDICNLKNLTWCPIQKDGQEASCNCPIIQGEYNFPPLNQQVPQLPSVIKPSLVEGKYKIKMTLYNKQKRLVCFETTADINF